MKEKLILMLLLSSFMFTSIEVTLCQDGAFPSSGQQAVIQNLVNSAESLIEQYKSKKITLEQGRPQAHEIYNTLEHTLDQFKSSSQDAENQKFVEYTDSVLLQVAGIFDLQTPITETVEQIAGSVNYFSYLWNISKNLGSHSFDAIGQAFARGEKWAQEEYAYLASKTIEVLGINKIISILTSYFGYNREMLKNFVKEILIKYYNLREPSSEMLALVKEALEKSGITKEVTVLEGGSNFFGIYDAFVFNLPGIATFLVMSQANDISQMDAKKFIAYHEVGHIYYNHNSLTRTSMLAVPMLPFFAMEILKTHSKPLESLNPVEKILTYSFFAYVLSFPLVFMAYSQAQELDADIFACEQLMRQGYAGVVIEGIGVKGHEDLLHPSYEKKGNALAKCLLENKEKISSSTFKDKNSDNWLLEFVHDDSLEMIKLLLDLGVQFQCKNNLSPLGMAIVYQRFDIVQTFLDHNITLETCNDQNPVIMYALAYDKPKTQELVEKYKRFGSSPLVQKALRLDMKDRPDDKARYYLALSLFNAIHRNQKELVRLLLKYGADPNYKFGDERIPFSEALLKKDIDLDIIKLLLKYGASPFLTYKNKSTLTLAQENDNANIIRLIEQSIARQNIKDMIQDETQTALANAKL